MILRQIIFWLSMAGGLTTFVLGLRFLGGDFRKCVKCGSRRTWFVSETSRDVSGRGTLYMCEYRNCGRCGHNEILKIEQE